ncbi:type II secretion system F family protein [Thermosediminibacter litoriperuensis]|uniref:type II secretion system F family protein n=1 Tax=Thermosediminibacter litoriperuensis TaxID=291989 RepID=UPI0011E62E9A|nr:type II secretion system F family protein [Thermosediminibacter litoriperuensis]
MSPETTGALTFTAVFLAAIGLSEIIYPDRERLNERLRQLAAGGEKKKARGSGRVEFRKFWRDLLKWAGSLSATRSLGKFLDKKLAEADIPLKGGEFIVLVAVLVLGACLFTLAVTFDLRAGVLAGAAAGVVPFVAVNSRRERWLSLFNAQMCDALTILANSLRSGFSFLQSMDLVKKELQGPVGKEFGRTISEINLGTPTEEAMKNMAERVNSRDLDLVVTAVLVQRQVGGNLSEVLDNIASVIRDRVRIKREIRAMTAQGRMSGLIIGMLPVMLGVFLFVTRPSYIMELFTDPVGRAMLMTAVMGEAVGFWLIRKIVDIDV